jgi:hypothetical protein
MKNLTKNTKTMLFIASTILLPIILFVTFMLGAGKGADSAYISETAAGDIADKYMYKYCIENKIDDCDGKYIKDRRVSLPIDLYIYPNAGEVYIVYYGSPFGDSNGYRIDLRWNGEVLGKYTKAQEKSISN